MVVTSTVASDRHVLHVFPAFDSGGAQMRTVQLMAMLPPGIRHTILAMNGSYRFTDHLPAGVDVETLPPPPELSFWRMGGFLAGLLRQRKPDLVMTYNWGSIEMVLGARRAGIPLVHHEDGFGPEETDRYLRRRIFLRRVLLRSTAAVAVPSRILADLAVTRWRVPESRVHYLPNGVDLAHFQPSREAPSDGNGSVIVGHVGHLRPEKNQRLLVEAFALCRARESARLRFFGDGSEAQKLRECADERGVAGRVEFMGEVADTAPVYHGMDVFALSSRTEQMPLTVLEAMASGLPVVSTDVGDVRAMVHESNRDWIVPRDDPRALAASLDLAVEDADRRRSVGAANRRHCEAEFDRDARYRDWVELYSTVLGLGP